MAKLEQRVSLNPDPYVKGLKKMQDTAKTTMKKVNNEFNDAGNAVDDFASRSKRKATEVGGTFDDLVKGISAGFKGLKGLSIPAIAAGAVTGLVAGAAAGEQQNRGAQRVGFRENLSAEESSGFKNALLDVSTAANVATDEIQKIAEVGLGFEATTREALKFAEVIARASRLVDGLDTEALAKFVGRDIRERGGEITGDAAKEVVDALVVASRNGFKDIQEAQESLQDFDTRQLKDAGQTVRDLVNTLGALRTTKGIAPDKADAFVKDILKLNDTLDKDAIKGLLGTNFTDAQGKLAITDENLRIASERLQGTGGREIQRTILQSGFSEEGIDTLFAASRNRKEFSRKKQDISNDSADLNEAFERSTNTLGEIFTSGFRNVVNALNKDLFVVTKEGFSAPTEKEQIESGDGVSDIFQAIQRRRESGTLTSQAILGNQSRGPAQEIKVRTEIDITSKDPGFKGIPKSNELNRDPRGI